jgi:FkbM family methyltransferase
MLIGFTQLRKKYNMNISGIIHIGAHHGEEISEYIRNGIQDIILFEPLSSNFEILEQNVSELNANISGHQVALGNDEKMVSMYVSDNQQQSSSILKPKLHLKNHPTVGFPGVEEVEMVKLDKYMDETSNYNFINMDVQGYELEVLRGGSETLNHVDYVYCEVNRDEVYENNAYVEEIDEFLSAYDMERVETFWQGGIWGDALYVRKEK